MALTCLMSQKKNPVSCSSIWHVGEHFINHIKVELSLNLLFLRHNTIILIQIMKVKWLQYLQSRRSASRETPLCLCTEGVNTTCSNTASGPGTGTLIWHIFRMHLPHRSQAALTLACPRKWQVRRRAFAFAGRWRCP